jgi:DNA-binding CsgD family transcriptional regulator
MLEGAGPALPHCEESLAFYRERSDAPRIARALVQAAALSLPLDDTDRTTRYIEAALAALAVLQETAWAERAACHVRWVRGIQTKDLGDFARSEAYLREVIAMQEAMARQTGKEQPHACGPHLTLGSILHCRNDLERALEHYRAALEKAWRFQNVGITTVTLARIAGMLALRGRWREAARLFGAIEAHCDRVGFPFAHNVWRLTRAFGLPQPWQGETQFTNQAGTMWAATVQRLPHGIPPLPDPVAAAELWEAGRALPMVEAVNYALAVDALQPSASHVMPATGVFLASARRPVLTRREQDVLALLCQRRTNAEIADQLYLSQRTVEDHVSRLLGKLQVTNRRDAAAQAARLGLIVQMDPLPVA